MTRLGSTTFIIEYNLLSRGMYPFSEISWVAVASRYAKKQLDEKRKSAAEAEDGKTGNGKRRKIQEMGAMDEKGDIQMKGV